jgi:RimJ/RimL family protein N-acetyltransferase
MTPPPHLLSTPRLRLRRTRLGDAKAIFRGFAQDPEVTRYLTWQPHTDISQTRAFLLGRRAAWAKGDDLTWAITLLEADSCIGLIGLRRQGFKADIGYVLARPHWGRGVMTEAARAVVDWAFADPAIHRVWATCDVDNLASARVLENAGMSCEGVLRRWLLHPQISDTPRDCFCYARVRSPQETRMNDEGPMTNDEGPMTT